MIVLWKLQICSFSLLEIVLLNVESSFLLLFSVNLHASWGRTGSAARGGPVTELMA